LKFLFEFKLQLGFSPLAQSSPPGWLNPTSSGLGRSNRPSLAPLFHPSLPQVALANPNSRRRRPAFLPASGELCHRHLGQTLRLSVLYPLLQLDSSAASSQRRSVAGSRLGSAGSGCLRAQCLPSPLLVLVVRHRGGRGACACRWKHPRSGAPGAAAVKTSPGSPWPAAQALPCHAVQACAWASGECVPFLLFLSPLFSGHGYWPNGHNQ
jgi:hypothetical protein